MLEYSAASRKNHWARQTKLQQNPKGANYKSADKLSEEELFIHSLAHIIQISREK